MNHREGRDGSGLRFLRVVIRNSADAMDFVDDARRGLGQELVGEGVWNGGHEVGGADGAEDDDVAVDALVAHDSDGLGQVESGVGLGDLIIEAGLTDHGDEDMVGLTGHADLLLGHFAEHTDGDTGA